MTATAIEIQKLRKVFTLGVGRSDTFRDSFSNLFRNQPTVSAHSLLIALDDVSFSVECGARVGIIGRNGAGKSTLLKILSRIIAPTSGRAILHGRVASLLEVGTGFHGELTGVENVYMSGAVLGMKRADIRAQLANIIEFAEIERFIDTPLKRYSSGMQVRLGFAVAAHLTCDVLILDEVLAVGDQRFQEKCLGKVATMSASDGKTVLFVSHNLSAVRRLCERTLLLDEGRVVADGATIDVLNAYAATGSGLSERSFSGSSRPGLPGVRLDSVRARAASGGRPTTAEGFTVEVEVEVDGATEAPGFALIARRPDGECVFSSLSNRLPSYRQPLRSGRYRVTCFVPANLLNSGVLLFSINIFKNGYAETITIPDVLTVDVDDSPALRGDYLGGWEGAVRPDLPWKMESL